MAGRADSDTDSHGDRRSDAGAGGADQHAGLDMSAATPTVTPGRARRSVDRVAPSEGASIARPAVGWCRPSAVWAGLAGAIGPLLRRLPPRVRASAR